MSDARIEGYARALFEVARAEGTLDEVEDELFFVHRGRLLMRFRDRDEVVNEGEFIIVPHGVEHCPVALSDICEVMLLEPATTMNTGQADDPRRVTDLASV